MYILVLNAIPQPQSSPVEGQGYWPSKGWNYDEARYDNFSNMTFSDEERCVLITPTPRTLEGVMGYIKQQVYKHAYDLISTLFVNTRANYYHPIEVITFITKRNEAMKYLSSNDPIDAPWLQSEVDMINNLGGSITLDALASSIMSKGSLEVGLQAICSTRKYHCDVIDSLDTIDQVCDYDWLTLWP